MNDYELFGKLIIEQEILNGKIQAVRQRIANQMSKEADEQKQKGSVKKEDGQTDPAKVSPKKS